MAELPPDLLGDTRDALVASVPSEIRAPYPASDRRRLLTAAVMPMRGTAGPPRPEGRRILAEVHSHSSAGSELLGRAEIVPDRRDWQELEFSLPPGEAGELVLRLRWDRPNGGPASAAAVAWGNPVLAPRPAAAGRPAAGRPDVLLVTVDTFRADALSHAPGLSAILAGGCLWTVAVAPSNWTLPSYASLLTGRAPAEHGAGRARDGSTAAGSRDYRGLQGELPTLAEQFRKAGYATAMVHQNPFLEPWTGLDRGFERYVRTREDTTLALSVAGDWWQRSAARPRLLVVHLMAPHLPYSPPGADELGPDPLAALDLEAFFASEHSPEERRRFFDLPEQDRLQVSARYRAEVVALDRQLAPWLEEMLAADPPPLFAFHADHGEELWDSGSFEHGHSFHDAVVRVPVGIVWPGRVAAERRDDAVGAHWLASTLLRLAGVPRPAAWRQDLFDRHGTTTTSSSYYLSDGHGRRFDVATGRSRELDPAEAVSADGPPAELSEELESALRELGY